MESTLSRLALAIVAAAFALNLAVLVFGHATPGWTVAWRDGRLVVVDVQALGRADRLAAVPGDIVVSVDGQLPVATDAVGVVSGHFGEASVMTAANARATEQTGVLHDYVGTLTIGFAEAQLQGWGRILAALGLGLFVGGVAALRAWRPTGTLHEQAVPIAAAVSTPLLVFTSFQLGQLWSGLVAGVLGAASLAVLAYALAGSLDARLRAGLLGGALVVVGAVVVPPALRLLGSDIGPAALPGAALAVGGIALGARAARARRRRDHTDVVSSLEVLFVGVAVGTAWASLALSSDAGFFLPPLVGWLSIAGLAGLVAVRPLVSRATRARLERDTFAEALEAQRALIAADLHDDALQDLTHLVRRLDGGGDQESADLAREVADRLRDLTYELRLPLLDDLGAGSAIEWFVTRIERLRGVTIVYERDEGGRPPPEIELAFFRVAQEALTNAVKHGEPPIVLRYESGAARARLSVEDAGSGVPPDLQLADGRHFGLVSMRQRAEMVGGRLTITDAVGGGTRVEMDWGAR